jgi:hypothetical protein|tara:strand:+ start:82 stop:246 length:165 start_codon:yes stop_codon:yes gene_type:complete
MWKWIKNLINKFINTVERKALSEKLKPDYSKMTKGDLKKLLAQGKIKDIYNPDK